MLSSAGGWRIPLDDLEAIRESGTIGQVVTAFGTAGETPVVAEGWIIGWLDQQGKRCLRHDAVAVRLQVYKSDAARVRGRVILVPLHAASA
jgi:hypothetical protein